MNCHCTYAWVTDISQLEPRAVVQDPKFLAQFINHWLEYLPDLSDFPTMKTDELQFWLKKTKSKRAPKPHAILQGVAGKRVCLLFGRNNMCAG